MIRSFISKTFCLACRLCPTVESANCCHIAGSPKSPPKSEINLGSPGAYRKIIKTRGHFPSDDAASKLIWLALRNITADWGRAAKDWKEAMNQFAILYTERFEGARV